jgi:hypothetical protein
MIADEICKKNPRMAEYRSSIIEPIVVSNFDLLMTKCQSGKMMTIHDIEQTQLKSLKQAV